MKNNFIKIKNILDINFCNFIYEYAIVDEIYFKSRLSKEQFEQMYIDNQFGMFHKETFSKYADPIMETLLLLIKAKIENAVGENLLPTYSYYRNYRPGYELVPHVDREACEISVSIFFGCDYDRNIYSWDLGIKNETNIFELVDLDVSDGVVYNGLITPHGRPKFEPPNGRNHVQGFFHYVKTNGPFADQKYDKREYLGFPSLESGR